MSANLEVILGQVRDLSFDELLTLQEQLIQQIRHSAATQLNSTPQLVQRKRSWPPGFFEQTFGSLRDEPMVREPEGDFEVRDEIL